MDDKRAFKTINLNTNFKESTDRLEQLRANRLESEIPLNDEYWKALSKHRMAHSKGEYGNQNN